jgi:hypothetical protein
MSTFAKGLTIGALVSASLAAPIVATVSYFQNQPKSAPLVLIRNPESLSDSLAQVIAEPDAIAVDSLPVERAPRRAAVVRLPSAPPRDPAQLELGLPGVVRPAALGDHSSGSPSVRSIQMPGPVERASMKEDLVYEEHLR